MGRTKKTPPLPPAVRRPACPACRLLPRPSQLVTKEKHAATLMQLGKCYFSNAARFLGLNL